MTSIFRIPDTDRSEKCGKVNPEEIDSALAVGVYRGLIDALSADDSPAVVRTEYPLAVQRLERAIQQVRGNGVSRGPG